MLEKINLQGQHVTRFSKPFRINDFTEFYNVKRIASGYKCCTPKYFASSECSFKFIETASRFTVRVVITVSAKLLIIM